MFIRGRQMGLQPLVIFKWKKTETQEKEFDFFLPSDLDGLKQLCLLQPDQCLRASSVPADSWTGAPL